MNYMFIRATVFDRPLNTWDVTAVTTMTSMFNNSGLSIANYDGILHSWSTQAVKPRVSLGAAEKHYCTAQTARNTLTNAPHRWVITDAGQACPPTSITLSHNNVPENTTTVGTISSTDINMPHTYVLVEGIGSEDNATFTLNAETGALSFVTAPDFENPHDLGASAGNNTYAIRVQAKNAVGLTTEKNFVITVRDVDDVAPIVTIIPTTKANTGPITDTVIEISDRFSIASVAVDNLSTAATDSLSCAPIPGSTTDSVDFPYINNAPSPTNHITIRCSIRITSTGKLAITAMDMLDYGATSIEFGYVIDTVGPNFSVANVDTETYGLHQPIVHFNAEDPSGVTRYDIIYKKDNGAAGVDTEWTIDTVESSGTHTINLDPDEPQHVVEVKAYDPLGNFTTRRIIFPPNIIITAPTMASNQPINDATITITSPVAGNLIDDIVISGSASADVTLGLCTDKDHNTIAPYNTKVTCEVHNIHTTGMIIIEAKDITSGAVGSNAQKFFFDTTAPTITIHAPTKIQKTTITDTAITVYDDVSILPHTIVIDTSSTATADHLSCTTDAHDEKRINCTIAVTASGNVAIKATDLSGNSTIVYEDNYIIDQTDPVVTISSTETITATNVTNYPVTGTCTAGDGDVTVTSNDQPHFTECSHDGAWQLFLDLSSYSDGVVTIGAKQTDVAGNSAEVSTTLSKDTEAPITTVNALLTNETSPRLTGIVSESDATVHVDIDGKTYPVQNNLNGTWTLAAGSITPTLTEGAHVAIVTGSDSVGNTTTHRSTITVDLTPPQTPTAAPDLQSSSDSGSSDTDNITNIATPVFDVTCTEENSVVTLYSDHTDYATASCTAPGTVEVAMTSALEDGVHHITYKETDAARNTSATSPALTITVLANPPTPHITINPITDDNIINITELSAPIAVTGTISNVIDSDAVTITLNEKNYTTQVASGTFTLSIPGSEFLADSSRTINASVTTYDVAGNTTTGTQTRAYEINTSVPGAPSAPNLQSSSDSGSSDTDNITNIATPVFDVFCSKEDNIITLYLDGVSHTTLPCTTSGIAAIQTTAALTDGTYAVTYTERDSVGNESSHSLKLQIKIRTTPPLLSLIGSDHINIPLHTPFTGVDARATNTLGEDFSHLITLSGSIDIHTPGTYILTYSVTDLAGNAATPITRTITVDDAIEEPTQQDPEMSDVAVETPGCTKTKPSKLKNITVDATKDSRVLVTFKKASGDVDRYQMKYGKTAAANDQKIKNIHKERRNYTPNDLAPGTTYYIKVRAVNECVQGSWSRAIKITTPSLGGKPNALNSVVQSNLVTESSMNSTPLMVASPEKITSASEQISKNDCSYTIKSGDTLRKIAKEELGEANRYQEIIELNQESYPNLSQLLNVGQKINLPCKIELREELENNELVSEENIIDEMKIKIINQKGKPLKNIKVTLYSEPQETLTNDEGIATFFNVIPGEHRIVVQGEKEQTELNVNLTENKNANRANDFTIAIKERDNWLLWITVALFSSVLILGYLLTKNKNKN